MPIRFPHPLLCSAKQHKQGNSTPYVPRKNLAQLIFQFFSPYHLSSRHSRVHSSTPPGRPSQFPPPSSDHPPEAVPPWVPCSLTIPAFSRIRVPASSPRPPVLGRIPRWSVWADWDSRRQRRVSESHFSRLWSACPVQRNREHKQCVFRFTLDACIDWPMEMKPFMHQDHTLLSLIDWLIVD